MLYDCKITGRVLMELRKKRGLTQEVVSGLACIPRSHLAMIESGQISPKMETLWRIADALGVKLSEVIAAVEKEIK